MVLEQTPIRVLCYITSLEKMLRLLSKPNGMPNRNLVFVSKDLKKQTNKQTNKKQQQQQQQKQQPRLLPDLKPL